METINERIKKVLEASGCTAAEFAEKLNVQRSSISHILSGRNKPSLDFITKLYSAFPSTDLHYLVTGVQKTIQADHKSPSIQESSKQPTPVVNSDSKPLVTDVNRTERDDDVTDVNNTESDKDTRPSSVDIKPEQAVTHSGRAIKIILLYEDGRFQEFTP